MRNELFHMERNLLEVGDSVEIVEGVLANAYYYTVIPSIAMSMNYELGNRILSTNGTVIKKTREGSTYCLIIEFEN